ncbi:sugar ABC transporter permease [Mesorhizobium sp. RP14(2022)]|uniref:Sugar ABC transporter permease n=1 Tax=Mesorhizobium liriopis TaxID=2953882 RepID=A0ABT1C0Y1_9HYPH|nr:sugar ABC transporter permease [Mesorhizobium liriopis]MCO6048491.1 sugar ABC transporter permease [Mesorhizobium liriopis]
MTRERRLAPYLFLAPSIVLGTVFFVVPLLVSLALSFAVWDSLKAPRFVGIANYRYLLTRDPLFYESLWNTARFVGATIIIGVPLALALAVAFRRSRWKPLWRSAFWLPMVTNIVAVAYVWQFLLADPYGLVNRTLSAIGIAGPAWLADPAWAMSAIILVFIWFHLGQDMMLISAGLDAVDEEVEEAASLDGANRWEVLWHITLPLIRPTMLLVLMTNLVKGIGYFALMLVLTDGGPANSTNVAALHVYRLAFENLRLGMASAAAYLLLAVVMAVLLVQFRVMRRGGLDAWR